jgi:predicted nucleic acid-binding OB-fold protein
MEHVGDNLILFLRDTATQLEELQLQTSLGISELSEKLEELKKESFKKYQQAKADINTNIDRGEDKWNDIKSKLEHLELQLSLGKAETIDLFEAQKKNLISAFNDVKKIVLDK